MTARESLKRWLISILLWVWTGALYFFGEVVWKTSQHRPESISWTMFLLAIFLAIPLERFGDELSWHTPIWLQALICAIGITITEFIAGLVLNIWLGLAIWDYSSMPYNLLGQICPQFFVLWIALSTIGIIMLDWMRYILDGGEKPHYHITFGGSHKCMSSL